MIRIKLERAEWQYDELNLLGPPGAFGSVFGGLGNDDTSVAVKRLDVSLGEARREYDIADFLVHRELTHVIPTYDAGLDKDTGTFYVVMGKADFSLAHFLKEHGTLDEKHALEILRQVTIGLLEVPELVHRDLKPGNILYHSGLWKIADFGIAKFVEESTSLQTVRSFLSSQYAAPEQWNYQSPSEETDIYALGCIAHAILTGTPPFAGPSREDFQTQHLYQAPPRISNASPQLASFINLMLSKAAQARPTKQRTLEALGKFLLQQAPSGGFSTLAKAGLAVSETQAMEEAEYNRALAEKTRREQLAVQGREAYDQLFEEFIGRVIQHAPIVRRSFSKQSFTKGLTLGSATLTATPIDDFGLIKADAFHQSGWDVILGVFLQVVQNSSHHYLWEANLWYTDLGKKESYRWWEVSYFGHPGYRRHEFQPFATTYLSYADNAASPHVYDIAFATGPFPTDGEHFEEFSERWANLLALASQGELREPLELPVKL